MPSPDRLSLRLVVQRIWESSSRQLSYRLLAYSNDHTYRAIQFDSRDEVLELLKVALPKFDASRFFEGSQAVTSIEAEGSAKSFPTITTASSPVRRRTTGPI